MGQVMDPRDYCALAAELAAKAEPTAAELRTAVSRAYYAVYNVATALLHKMGIKLPAGWEAHKLAGEALRYGGNNKVSIASREIDDLRKARWAADYDMEDNTVEDHRTIRKLVARAKQAIHLEIR